jgi:hypothetical protein
MLAGHDSLGRPVTLLHDTWRRVNNNRQAAFLLALISLVHGHHKAGHARVVWCRVLVVRRWLHVWRVA